MPMLNNWILSGLFFITMKTFEITKDLLVEMAGWGNTRDNKKIRELFPEAFEPELIKGIWYKSTNKDNPFLLFVESAKEEGYRLNVTWYGFDSFNQWAPILTEECGSTTDMTPASEEEVFERLKEEAVKRGFKEGVNVDRSSLNCDFLYNGNKVCKIQYSNFSLIDNDLFIGGHVILHKGIWAEICITKEQAEKELGKKII